VGRRPTRTTYPGSLPVCSAAGQSTCKIGRYDRCDVFVPSSGPDRSRHPSFRPVAAGPPKIGDKLVPVFTEEELARLLDACKGGGFQNRRDYAIISLFKDTGARLSELAGLGKGDLAP
jgi:integrase